MHNSRDESIACTFILYPARSQGRYKFWANSTENTLWRLRAIFLAYKCINFFIISGLDIEIFASGKIIKYLPSLICIFFVRFFCSSELNIQQFQYFVNNGMILTNLLYSSRTKMPSFMVKHFLMCSNRTKNWKININEAFSCWIDRYII